MGRLGAVAIAVALLLAAGAAFTRTRLTEIQGVRQPIAFNHKAHTSNQVECSTCHQYLEQQAFAGLPAVEVCLGCHAQALTESQEEEKVRQYAKAGKEIPWVQLTRLPGDVYFSHRRHVLVAKEPCQSCHGAIAESERPPRVPPISLTMDRCLSCHQVRQASTACIDCHR